MTKRKAVDFGIKNNQTTQNYECLTTTQKDKICKRCGYTRKDTIKEVRDEILKELNRIDKAGIGSARNRGMHDALCIFCAWFDKKFGVDESRVRRGKPPLGVK